MELNKQLLEDIEAELRDDVGNYGVSDLGDLENWSEACLDCPSNSLMRLLKKIPNDSMDEHYEVIDGYISQIVKDVTEELKEDEE